MKDALLDEYQQLYNRYLIPVARQLERLIASHLQGLPRIDRVSARAKSPDRFHEKAGRKTESGKPRYTSPLTQIQDQVAARVVVFYHSDVEPTTSRLLNYFQPIENRTVIPDSDWKFGYFGKHLILALPGDAIPRELEPIDIPRFFELQVKTLFQHAWSEANHDLGYKPVEALDDDQTRRLAFTSAQAWGADRIFHELFQELVSFESNQLTGGKTNQEPGA